MKIIKGIARAFLLSVFTASVLSFWYPVNIAQAAPGQSGWTQVNGRWHYYDELTGARKIGWMNSSGKWYLMDSDGSMVTGWVKDKDKWYFLEDSGAMKTGWLSFNNKWYYLYQDGSMAVNTTIDSYTIGLDGTLIETVNSENLEKVKQKWEGNWSRLGDTIHSGSNIRIRNVSQTSLYFELSAFNGANTGNLEGTAAINGNTAVYTDNDMSFNITFAITNDSLEVKPGGNFVGVFGNGVTINGNYKREAQEKKLPTLVGMQVLKTKEQEEIFKQLVKDDYKLFIEYFQIVTEQKDLDGFGAKVYSGGIRGLFTICEGIVMSNGDKIWAALLNDNRVKYYTNSTGVNTLPKTIENWRSSFKDAKVIYVNSSLPKDAGEKASGEGEKTKGDGTKIEPNLSKKSYAGSWKVLEAFTMNSSTNTQVKIDVNIEIECKSGENTILGKNKENTMVINYKENVLPDGDIALIISDTKQFYYAANKDLLSQITDLGEGNYEVMIFQRVKSTN